MQHCYSLDLNTQQIWDYVGDEFVQRLNQSNSDGKLSKKNSQGCESVEGDCGNCGGDCEDSGFSGALFNSKVEAVSPTFLFMLG